ncbi:MAG: amidohydrolase [Desulfitobacteriia bacterium]
MEHQKLKILKTADSLLPGIWGLAREIGLHPEEGYQEYLASELLTGYLKAKGFTVEMPLAGMATAFFARFRGKEAGVRIAYLAEYDALPDIGHGCGHNLIGAASVGAAAILSTLPNLKGEIIVIGSPAEETSGAKVALAEAGIFQDIDTALMFHPGSCNVPEISSLALDAIEVSFHGRSSHMAVSDNIGVNALEALINLFGKVNKIKRRLARDERIDGIIIQGGKSPNIVPDLAVARFYLRAGKRANLNKVREKFLECAHKAAAEVRAQMSWRFYEFSYHEMKTNSSLAKSFRDNLLRLGVKDIEPPQTMLGSVDMGNVSQLVPSLHAYLRLGNGVYIPHTVEFAQRTLSREGENVLSLAVRALSLTGYDVLTDERLQEKIKRDFRRDN